jgi:hypothetical protein
MSVDRTISKVGQQYLYATLRTIDVKGTGNHQLEKLTSTFEQDNELREAVGVHLYRLSHKDAYHIPSLFLKAHLQPPKWFWIVKVLSIISLLLIILIPFYPKVFLLLVAVLIGNYGIHYWNKKNLFQYIVSIPQLIRLKQVTKDLFKQEKLKVDTDELNQAIRTLDKVGFSMSFLTLDAKLESDIGAAFQAITELIKALFLLEPLLLFYALRQLDTKREHINMIFRYVGMVDTAISIGSLREGLAYYCKPVMNTMQKTLAGTELYHPLIHDPVANSITLVNKSVLLTGSNMSGKTTFIRTIGINIILAQTIDTCFAKEFIMPPMRVFSAIRIADDLLSDKSYYFEEVLTIKKMIEESQSEIQTLFLLDEIFKGTNTVERIAAGKAVLSYLNKGQHIVFVSTHDIELTDYLKDSFDLYHFTEVVEDDKIAFDYKLKEGNLKTRNAIRILELNQYPIEVINEAKILSEKITNTMANMD